MEPRKRGARVGLALALLLGVCVSCGKAKPVFLGPVGITTNTGGSGKVGDILNVGFQFSADKGKAVTLRSAKLLGVAGNLESVGDLVAIHTDQIGSAVGALWGDLFTQWRKKGFVHQVSGVVIEPGLNDWDLVAEVRSKVPGDYRTSGIALTYRVDNVTYTQSFPFKIHLTVTR